MRRFNTYFIRDTFSFHGQRFRKSLFENFLTTQGLQWVSLFIIFWVTTEDQLRVRSGPEVINWTPHFIRIMNTQDRSVENIDFQILDEKFFNLLLSEKCKIYIISFLNTLKIFTFFRLQAAGHIGKSPHRHGEGRSWFEKSFLKDFLTFGNQSLINRRLDQS